MTQIARTSSGEFWESVEIPIQRKDGEIRIVLWNSPNVYAQDGAALTATIAQGAEWQKKESIRYENLPLETFDGRRIEVEFVSNVYLVNHHKVIQYNIRDIIERTAQLESANSELEAFAYSVSHDLRAPLRGIDGWSLVLLEDYNDQLDEQARQYLGRVRAEAQRMGHLIDELLQLSRVTRAEMQRGPVGLSALAQTAVVRLKESQPERQAGIMIQSGLTAHGDAHLLEIVLINLLGNAWKFTGPRSQARNRIRND